MSRPWQWIVAGVAIVIVASELAEVLPRLLPSLAGLVLLAIALRIAWFATRDRF